MKKKSLLFRVREGMVAREEVWVEEDGRKILMQGRCKHGTLHWNMLEEASVLSGLMLGEKEKKANEVDRWWGEWVLNLNLFSSSPSKKNLLFF